MDTIVSSEAAYPIRQPWNKGKLIGAKPPLRPKARLGRENTPSIVGSL